jgi:hypothetical protein
MNSRVQVVYTDSGGLGYHCLYYMALLAAECFGSELIVLPLQRASLLKRVSGVLSAKSREGNNCLLICPSPVALDSVLLLEDWRRYGGRIAAWVFDSFWTSYIPRWASRSRIFDSIFVTEGEDLGEWRRRMHAPVEWLPWGSDVLSLGSMHAERELDLLRVGRQPQEWEDDKVTEQKCAARHLRFHGRPPGYETPTENEQRLMKFMSGAKFVLAFSNRVSPSIQTHPEREYITGRWTDSLASGASVAGIPPRSESVQSLLWPEALLDIASTSQEEGLDRIASAVRDWSPQLAQVNYLRSLEKLDWRWRFNRIAETMAVRTDWLDAGLARIREVLQRSDVEQASR